MPRQNSFDSTYEGLKQAIERVLQAVTGRFRQYL